MSVTPVQPLVFSCIDIPVRIDCNDQELYKLLEKNFEKMLVAGDSCTLMYDVQASVDSNDIVISRHGSEFHALAGNAGEVIYLLESDIVVQLQLLRQDLLFLHAAAIADGRGVHLITGPSGAGKSTSCWGLVHHGFSYMTDELVAISLQDFSVRVYRHALCLKSSPSADYPLPDDTCVTDRGFHIRPSSMPQTDVGQALQVKTILFLEYQATAEDATAVAIRNAEAATRLYPNILNALAHNNDGLDAAVRLTAHADCYQVVAADLARTCALIEKTVRRAT